MKQVVGFLFIICSFPFLFFISREIWNEIAVAKTYEEQIHNEIQLPEMKSQLPVTMVDRNGQIFSEEYVEWRQPLPLKEIPEVVKQLFLLSEDQQYFEHIGFNLSAITRAVVVNSSEQSIEQGGSTITQQLVRMRYLSEEKTYERKLTELFYAYELEQMYDKNTILEMYLNEIYFSNQVYGIGAAATYYFQKPLAQLTIPQMAFIAAIPNNPSLYDPLIHFDNTKARQERLIDLLAEKDVITTEEAQSFKQEAIALNLKSKIQQYPTYSTYVMHELKLLIAQNDGFNEQLQKVQTKEEEQLIQEQINQKFNQLLQSGIMIETALHPEKQTNDEQQINAILGSGSLQASAVVIDNTTREIVSLYGGKDYKKLDFHRAYQGTRQPGSAFKPLIVYAPLFETTNYTPNSIVSGGRFCIGNFCPQNYGGGVYGNVSISTAFRHSYNTSALRLFQQIGLETGFGYINRFNFKSIVEQDKTYAAGLGGLTYGVTTLEMADAYTSFIDGTYNQVHSIRHVKDKDGNILYTWPTERERIWSEQTVRSMRSVLRDVVTSGTGRGLRSNSSYLGAKTGTTNDYKDFWLAGLTNEYTTAIWIGYDTPKSMQALENDQIHFSIFNTIMN
ncbi:MULTISPECIES: transglycosylase domain-containing protein [Lysinibacillus]|uniref:Penicillin-binding protein n=1 Tax=Lysinibacillus antri TaxID=2498145 RepID=A0A432L7G5_9BACI|nr:MULTISPECIES: transglycosylase domain-containing protein [Lysinibacillus]RUL46943.1 penicillin-binding protein [Lysinibacillus antri]TSI10450.1 penicillin-binding protein [Lysinibacillus sp. BW-2-10]